VNLQKYTELTGIEVPSSKEASVKAHIRRTQAKLESMLGFTLDSRKTNTNIYNELGKTKTELSCLNVETSDLLPADEVIGSYRLYRFNSADEFLHIDPFVNINKVKLVHIKTGDFDEASGVTLKTFEDNEVYAQIGRDGIGKYILRHPQLFCGCSHNHKHEVQLAVDANWMFEGCLPLDLQYVWADMVEYYSNPKSRIRSESIEGHSYTKSEIVAPETEKENLAIIRKYAGPYGSVSVMPV